MALTPQLHPAHRLRATEVIAVAVFAEPPSLTGSLAGLPTGEPGTIPLPIGGSRVRNKKLIATAAFSSALRAAHCQPNVRRTNLRRNEKEDRQEEPNSKKEEES